MSNLDASMSKRSTSSDGRAPRAGRRGPDGGFAAAPLAAEVLSLDDLETAARHHLPRPIFGYVSGAAETNLSLHDNRAVFRELGFLPRVLTDVSRRSQQSHAVRPILRSPVRPRTHGYQRPRGVPG